VGVCGSVSVFVGGTRESGSRKIVSEGVCELRHANRVPLTLTLAAHAGRDTLAATAGVG
jgi:hypothetical protein